MIRSLCCGITSASGTRQRDLSVQRDNVDQNDIDKRRGGACRGKAVSKNDDLSESHANASGGDDSLSDLR